MFYIWYSRESFKLPDMCLGWPLTIFSVICEHLLNSLKLHEKKPSATQCIKLSFKSAFINYVRGNKTERTHFSVVSSDLHRKHRAIIPVASDLLTLGDVVLEGCRNNLRGCRLGEFEKAFDFLCWLYNSVAHPHLSCATKIQSVFWGSQTGDLKKTDPRHHPCSIYSELKLLGFFAFSIPSLLSFIYLPLFRD